MADNTILWHGTVKYLAESIRVEGLKPNPAMAFHVNHIPDPCAGCVYLSKSEHDALMFAITRAAYLKTKPGQWGIAIIPFFKRRDAQAPVTGVDLTPVLIRFEIPLAEFSKTWHDPDSGADYLPEFIYPGTVPPKYIREIRAINQA